MINIFELYKLKAKEHNVYSLLNNLKNNLEIYDKAVDDLKLSKNTIDELCNVNFEPKYSKIFDQIIDSFEYKINSQQLCEILTKQDESLKVKYPKWTYNIKLLPNKNAKYPSKLVLYFCRGKEKFDMLQVLCNKDTMKNALSFVSEFNWFKTYVSSIADNFNSPFLTYSDSFLAIKDNDKIKFVRDSSKDLFRNEIKNALQGYAESIDLTDKIDLKKQKSSAEKTSSVKTK